MSKKKSILLILCLCLAVSACSSKKENLEKKIIGTWEPRPTIALLTSGHSADPLVFMNDKTMEKITPKVNTVLGEIGGTSEGIYEIEGNELTTALDLPMLDSTFTVEQTYTIEIKGSVMYMECMDCGEVIEYVKMQ